MKTTNLILLSIVALIGGIAFFFVCRYTYIYKVTELNQKAKEAFVKVVDREVKSRDEKGELALFFNAEHLLVAQMPDSVHFQDASGSYAYKLDTMKMRMNITDDINIRSVHSCVFRKKPIQLDSLNMIWRECLIDSGFSTIQSALCISVMDGNGNIESQKGSFSKWCSQSNCIFTTYIGYASEIEVKGYLHYSVWQMMYLYVLSYLLLYGICTYGVYTLCVFAKKMISKREKKLAEPTLIIQIAKGVEETQISVYRLRENLIFYAQENKIVCDGVEHSLAAQASQLLRLFLDAEDHLLSDNVILKNLWGDEKTAAYLMQKAITRLRGVLEKIDLTIKIKRGNQNYQLLL